MNTRPTEKDYYAEGNKLFKEERWEEAVSEFNAFMSLCPTHLDGAYMRGLTYIRLNHHANARADFELINEHKKQDPAQEFHAHYLYGLGLYHLAQYGIALIEMKKSLELQPDYQPALHQKGWLYIALKKHDAACGAFEEAIRLKPDAKAHLAYGNALYAIKRYHQAIEQLDKAINLDPSNNYAYYYKAYSLYFLDKKEEAELLFKKCADVAPDDFYAWYQYAEGLMQLEKYEACISVCDETLKRCPGYLSAINLKNRAEEKIKAIENQVNSPVPEEDTAMLSGETQKNIEIDHPIRLKIMLNLEKQKLAQAHQQNLDLQKQLSDIVAKFNEFSAKLEESNAELTKLKNKPEKNFIQLAEKELLDSTALSGIQTQEKISALLKVGASIKTKDSEGKTALHLALLHKNLEIAQYLLKIDPSLFTTKDNQGHTPIQLMAANGNSELVEWLDDERKLLTIPDYIYDLKEFDNIYEVATQEVKQLLANRMLLDASKTGALDEIKHALMRGANVDIKTAGGWTALHNAVSYDHDSRPAIVQLLLENGADPTLYTNKIGEPINIYKNRSFNKCHDSALDLVKRRTKDQALISMVATAYLIKAATHAPKAYELCLMTEEIAQHITQPEPDKLYVSPTEHGLYYFALGMPQAVCIPTEKLMKRNDESDLSPEAVKPIVMSMDDVMQRKDKIIKIAIANHHLPKPEISVAIDAKANLVGQDAKDGETALHKAVIGGYMPNIKLILKAHANAIGEARSIYTHDKSGKTAYDLAVESKQNVTHDGEVKPLSAAISEESSKYKTKEKEAKKANGKSMQASLNSSLSFLSTIGDSTGNKNEQSTAVTTEATANLTTSSISAPISTVQPINRSDDSDWVDSATLYKCKMV